MVGKLVIIAMMFKCTLIVKNTYNPLIVLKKCNTLHFSHNLKFIKITYCIRLLKNKV